MALLAGSIAYPSWGSLTGSWNAYSLAWRALATPFFIASLTGGASTGEIASAGAANPVSFDLAVAEPLGGRMIPAAGIYRWREMTGRWGEYSSSWRALLRSGVFAMNVPARSASANLVFNSSAAATFLPASAGFGNLSAGGGGHRQLTLLAESGSGGVYRQSNLPPAGLSRGRMTWRN